MLRWIIILLVSLTALSAQAQTTPVSECITTAVGGGTGDDITIPTLPCIPTTTLLILTATASNSTTAPTLKAPTIPAQVILSQTGTALVSGIIVAGGRYLLTNNGANWFLLNTSSTTPIPVPLYLADTQTAAVTTTGATFTANTDDTSISADLILSYTFCTSPCLPLPAQGGGNYDAVRGIGVVTPGTTTPIVAGVSGYTLSEQAFTGVVPFGVALFGTGAITVDGGRIEGINTNISDAQFRSPQSGAHNRLIQNEFDLSISYPDTDATALLISGNSTVQGTSTGGITLAYQNFSGSAGAIKWGQFLDTLNGTTDTFAVIGTKTFVPNGGGGVSTNSQDILAGAYITGTGFQEQLYFGTNTFGNNITPALNTNYPLAIATGGLIARSTTNQVMQLTGPVDLSSGTSVLSRNDANNSLLPLELVSDLTMVNAPFVLLQKTASVLNSTISCGAPTKGALAIVTDASGVPAWGGTMVGGGSGFNLVMCTGSAWIYQ